MLKKGASATAYERFFREIEVVKNMNHPSIIKIIDHSRPEDSLHYYVMEYIPGAKSLKRYMDLAENPFKEKPLQAVGLFIRIVEVIKYCKGHGIQHRHLSPANILIVTSESIKVIDFGLCHVADGTTITLTNEAVGTPDYMAPECEAGAEGQVDWRSDFYSAGKILWSAVTGSLAFSRDPPVFDHKSMVTLFPYRPDIWHLQSIFEKTIRRDASKRWQAPDAALQHARTLQFLISSGYPPLELIKNRCPVCGQGILGEFRHTVVFANVVQPPGGDDYDRLTGGYCGFCLARNRRIMNQSLEQRWPDE